MARSPRSRRVPVDLPIEALDIARCRPPGRTWLKRHTGSCLPSGPSWIDDLVGSNVGGLKPCGVALVAHQHDLTVPRNEGPDQALATAQIWTPANMDHQSIVTGRRAFSRLARSEIFRTSPSPPRSEPLRQCASPGQADSGERRERSAEPCRPGRPNPSASHELRRASAGDRRRCAYNGGVTDIRRTPLRELVEARR
jgi:hypothetical protein